MKDLKLATPFSRPEDYKFDKRIWLDIRDMDNDGYDRCNVMDIYQGETKDGIKVKGGLIQFTIGDQSCYYIYPTRQKAICFNPNNSALIINAVKVKYDTIKKVE